VTFAHEYPLYGHRMDGSPATRRAEPAIAGMSQSDFLEVLISQGYKQATPSATPEPI
jgi:hypothetical protein